MQQVSIKFFFVLFFTVQTNKKVSLKKALSVTILLSQILFCRYLVNLFTDQNTLARRPENSKLVKRQCFVMYPVFFFISTYTTKRAVSEPVQDLSTYFFLNGPNIQHQDLLFQPGNLKTLLVKKVVFCDVPCIFPLF